MRKGLKALARVLMVFAVIGLSQYPVATHASGMGDLVKVLYTTIDNPVVYTSNGPSSVKLTAYLSSPTRSLLPTDFSCTGTMAPARPVVIELFNSEFKVTCEVKFEVASPPGMKPIRLTGGYNGDDTALSPFILSPSNATFKTVNQVKDDFGQITKISKFDYSFMAENVGEILASSFVAVNPHSNFKFPEFLKFEEGYILFDSRNIDVKPLKVSVKKPSKLFSLSCPNNVPQKFSIGRQFYVVSIGESTEFYADKLPWFSYSDKKLQGKTLDIKCSVLSYVAVGGPKLDIPFTYTESINKRFKFPK